MNQYPSWDEIIEIKKNLHAAQMSHWLNHDLFSFGWWFILLYNLIVFLISWKLFDKTRIFELFTAFGIVVTLVSLFDVIGNTFVLFSYPTRLFPIFPPLFSAGFIVLPFIYMLMYQMFSKRKPFFVANIVLAILLAFIIEPILQWLNIYRHHNWLPVYSFIVYIFIGFTLKWLMKMLLKIRKGSYSY